MLFVYTYEVNEWKIDFVGDRTFDDWNEMKLIGKIQVSWHKY